MAIGRIRQKKQSYFEKLNIDLVIQEATSWEGTEYEYGSKGDSTIDCSGLITRVYQKIFHDDGIPPSMMNISKLRTTTLFETVNFAQKGDLILWDQKKSDSGDWVRSYHGGIVVDPHYAKFIHAGVTKGVSLSNYSSKYWSERWKGRVFRRYKGLSKLTFRASKIFFKD